MLRRIVWCHIFMSSRWLWLTSSSSLPPALHSKGPEGSRVFPLIFSLHYLLSLHPSLQSPRTQQQSYPPPSSSSSTSSHNNNKVSQVESYVLPSSSQLDPSCIHYVSLSSSSSSTPSPASYSSPIFVTGLRHREGSTLWPPSWQHQAET